MIVRRLVTGVGDQVEVSDVVEVKLVLKLVGVADSEDVGGGGSSLVDADVEGGSDVVGVSDVELSVVAGSGSSCVAEVSF